MKITYGNVQPNSKESKIWLDDKGLLRTYNSKQLKWNTNTTSSDTNAPEAVREIEFTINQAYIGIISCKALEGMTWREWYNSDYATDYIKSPDEMASNYQLGPLELFEAEGEITYAYFWRNFTSHWGGDGYGLCYSNGTIVNADKAIIEGGEYEELYSLSFDDVDDNGTPKTITFFVYDDMTGDTLEYKAEEGMPWGQFIETGYNTYPFYTLEYYDEYLIVATQTWGSIYRVISNDQLVVTSTLVIVPGYTYKMTDFMT